VAKAKETAGFMCAPEMCPIAYIITVTMNPLASEAPNFDTLFSSIAFIAAVPLPTNTNKNVPMTSANTYKFNSRINHSLSE
jgi:hypothetical protein